jgi:hypothetical protein
MKRSRPLMQDAVIVMGIIVILLALWRLGLRRREYGGFGGWATTNIFGSATLTVLPGAGQKGAPTGSPVAESNNAPASTASVNTNSSPQTEGFETNAVDTNVPVTAIADSDTIPAPPSRGTNVVDAATMEQRLGQAGAKGGDLQFSLFWKNINDLDLHCFDPASEEIYFQHPLSLGTEGRLDVDANAHGPYTVNPVENIYWPLGAAPAGLYRIYVVFYSERVGGGTPFTVRTVVRGKTNFFSATIFYTGERNRNWICTLQYHPNDPDPAKRYMFLRQ